MLVIIFALFNYIDRYEVNLLQFVTYSHGVIESVFDQVIFAGDL